MPPQLQQLKSTKPQQQHVNQSQNTNELIDIVNNLKVQPRVKMNDQLSGENTQQIHRQPTQNLVSTVSKLYQIKQEKEVNEENVRQFVYKIQGNPDAMKIFIKEAVKQNVFSSLIERRQKERQQQFKELQMQRTSEKLQQEAIQVSQSDRNQNGVRVNQDSNFTLITNGKSRNQGFDKRALTYTEEQFQNQYTNQIRIPLKENQKQINPYQSQQSKNIQAFDSPKMKLSKFGVIHESQNLNLENLHKRYQSVRNQTKTNYYEQTDSLPFNQISYLNSKPLLNMNNQQYNSQSEAINANISLQKQKQQSSNYTNKQELQYLHKRGSKSVNRTSYIKQQIERDELVESIVEKTQQKSQFGRRYYMKYIHLPNQNLLKTQIKAVYYFLYIYQSLLNNFFISFIEHLYHIQMIKLKLKRDTFPMKNKNMTFSKPNFNSI